MPRVSVLMTTYNGAGVIAQSIESILAQTFRDFELVVVDDASTDDSGHILSRISDSRLRVIRAERNLGIVGARNLAFAAARGEYIAAHDHDDISLPQRFAKQVACLDARKDIVLVGTEIFVADGDKLLLPDHDRLGLPPLMRWNCLVDNPLTYSSIMVRAAAIRRVGQFVREEFIYADDFDLYHRLLRVGEIVRLEEPLVIYRLHANNTSRMVSKTLNSNAAKVLCNAYTGLLGAPSEREAILVIRHLSMRQPVRDLDTLDTLGAHLSRLLEAFITSREPTSEERTAITASAATTWWHCVRAAVRSGGEPRMLATYRRYPALAAQFQPSATDRLGSAAVGALRYSRQALRHLVSGRP